MPTSKMDVGAHGWGFHLGIPVMKVHCQREGFLYFTSNCVFFLYIPVVRHCFPSAYALFESPVEPVENRVQRRIRFFNFHLFSGNRCCMCALTLDSLLL